MVKSFYYLIRNSLVAVIFFTIEFSCAQSNVSYSALQPTKKTYYFNFNDAVKLVQTRFVYKNPALKEYQYNSFRNRNDHRKGSGYYIEFHKNGQVKALSSAMAPDSVFMPVDKKKSFNSQYDAIDVKKKSLRKTNVKYYPRVFTDNLFIKASYNTSSYVIDYKRFILFETVYKYIYDKNKRIKEELKYSIDHDDQNANDTIPLKKARAKDLFSKTVFFYNDKNQVIKQRVYAGPKAKNDRSRTAQYSFGFLYETFTYDTTFFETRYQYDPKGRIIQAALYENEELLCSEDYYYHTTNDYVEKAIYYCISPDFYGNTKKSIRYYNQNGDILKREFVLDYPEQSQDERTFTRFYEYEYDSHNNWIKCTMYLQGSKEAGVTLISERKITYYNETEK